MFLTIRSCGFLWLFDLEERRFAHLPRDWPPGLEPPEEAWCDYGRLGLHAEEHRFVILAQPAGTPLVRGVIHVDPCEYCQGRSPVDQATSGTGRLALVWRHPKPGD